MPPHRRTHRLAAPRPARARWRRAAWVMAVLGLLSFGQGLWIEAKAVVAQVMLHHAWQRTRGGESRVRPWPWADTWPVARLAVPRLDETRIVLAGASGAVLAFGPGHLDGTALPGGPGNCVLSGHRDTHFAFLRRLRTGDELILETPSGRRHRYRVESGGVVDETDVSVLADSGLPVLTLVTCFPFDSLVAGGPLRWVVRAVPVS